MVYSFQTVEKGRLSNQESKWHNHANSTSTGGPITDLSYIINVPQLVFYHCPQHILVVAIHAYADNA